MSGRKQHYLPQFLLRGFGKQTKGDAIQVVVYPKGRDPFTAATTDAGAQRYFYSKRPVTSGEKTLDDRITELEPRLGSFFARLRKIPMDQIVDAASAAEAVAHLSARPDHMRQTVTAGVDRVWDRVAPQFLDQERFKREMGLDSEVPNETFREAIREAIEKFPDHPEFRGLSMAERERKCIAKYKANLDSIFAQQLPIMQRVMEMARDRTGDMVRHGHTRALERALAPVKWVETLAQLSWRLAPGPTEGLILPDCVAISAAADGTFLPPFFAGIAGSTLVLMPISHDRLLVGERTGGGIATPANLNEELASCSWTCFIARERHPRHEQLISRIRAGMESYLKASIPEPSAMDG